MNKVIIFDITTHLSFENLKVITNQWNVTWGDDDTTVVYHMQIPMYTQHTCIWALLSSSKFFSKNSTSLLADDRGGARSSSDTPTFDTFSIIL